MARVDEVCGPTHLLRRAVDAHGRSVPLRQPADLEERAEAPGGAEAHSRQVDYQRAGPGLELAAGDLEQERRGEPVDLAHDLQPGDTGRGATGAEVELLEDTTCGRRRTQIGHGAPVRGIR